MSLSAALFMWQRLNMDAAWCDGLLVAPVALELLLHYVELMLVILAQRVQLSRRVFLHLEQHGLGPHRILQRLGAKVW
jgi:hypothetical protein